MLVQKPISDGRYFDCLPQQLVYWRNRTHFALKITSLSFLEAHSAPTREALSKLTGQTPARSNDLLDATIKVTPVDIYTLLQELPEHGILETTGFPALNYLDHWRSTGLDHEKLAYRDVLPFANVI